MHSRTLLLTALGVMFCSGCMTEQQRQLIELGATLSNNEQGEVSTVFLSDTQITDAGLVHLEGLTSLTWLFLSRTQITDAGLAKLKETLPIWCEIHH